MSLPSHADWLAELAQAEWLCPTCHKTWRGIKQSPEGFLVAVCPECEPRELVFSWVTGKWRDRPYTYRVL